MNQSCAFPGILGSVAVSLVKPQVPQDIAVTGIVAGFCNPIDDLRGIKDGQILGNDADGFALPGFQIPGVQIGPVVQHVDDLPDLFLGLFADPQIIPSVQNEGHGAFADTGGVGYILHRNFFIHNKMIIGNYLRFVNEIWR